MDPKERFELGRRSFLATTNLKEPEKVPILLGMEAGWAFKYAGVKWTDVEDDPEAFAKAYTKAYREIPINMAGRYGPTRTSLKQAHALGNYKFVYTSDGGGIVHDQASDFYFGPEVYDEILVDQAGLQDKYSRINYPIFNGPRELAVEGVKKAAAESLKSAKTMELIANIMRDELGLFFMGRNLGAAAGSYGYTSEFWTFYDRYRGPHHALADLRRRPDKVYKAVDFLYEQTKSRVKYDEALMKEPYPVGNSMFHPEGYLSPKHFDDFYFSRFMETMGPVMEAGKKVYLYGEGAFLHHIHRFLETPKGSMIIVLDQDDPFEAKKIVGDHCTLVTGPKAELLQLGTIPEIKDFVKRCFDELAPGGGFMFSLGNGLISAKDADVARLVAAFELADELG